MSSENLKPLLPYVMDPNDLGIQFPVEVSVRPNVSGPDQWAYSRVNSYLFALRTGRFQGGRHDTDLFPKGHPLSSKT